MTSFSKAAFAQALVALWPKHSAAQLAQAAAHELMAQGATTELDSLLAAVEQVLAQRGHVVVRVVSAHTLSAKLRLDIKKVIRRQTGATDVEFQATIDPALLGGFVARAGEFVFDTSVRTNLNTLLAHA